MAKQSVNFGSASDGSQGDTARAAFTKINANFDEVYLGLDAKAPLASPSFTGAPAAVTPTATDNSTRLQTTAGSLLQSQSFGVGTTSLPTVTDANALTTSGFAKCNSGGTNFPTSGNWYTALNMPHTSGAGSQIAIPASMASRLHFRNQVGGNWTAWKEAATVDSPSFTGSLQCSGPIRTGQYTLASLPSASAWTGYEIDVTDAAGGAKRCRSDGTNWKILNTTTTVS